MTAFITFKSKPFSSIKYTLVFVFALFISLSIFGCNEERIDSDAGKLRKALGARGIDLSGEIDYPDLVTQLRDTSVAVPADYKNATMRYLDNHAENRIQLPTSKPGILAWHIEKIFFI